MAEWAVCRFGAVVIPKPGRGVKRGVGELAFVRVSMGSHLLCQWPLHICPRHCTGRVPRDFGKGDFIPQITQIAADNTDEDFGM